MLYLLESYLGSPNTVYDSREGNKKTKVYVWYEFPEEISGMYLRFEYIENSSFPFRMAYSRKLTSTQVKEMYDITKQFVPNVLCSEIVFVAKHLFTCDVMASYCLTQQNMSVSTFRNLRRKDKVLDPKTYNLSTKIVQHLLELLNEIEIF